MTQQKSIEGYDWIEVSQIESVIEKVPYLRIIYKDGTSFLIDWSIENKNRFEKLIK
jgi:hypothetical protein